MTTEDLFGGASPDDVTLDAQIACVERELKMRERVYARWVQSGGLTQASADYELLAIQAVLNTLRKVKAGQSHG